MDPASPLRYPGGKAGLAPLISRIIHGNRLADCIYAEPYAGGAGAGLTLLFAERVSRVMINDADTRVYFFWKSLLETSGAFLKLLEETPITIDEWHRQRSAYRDPSLRSALEVGFATFYLNRCNRSGIVVNGGPVGGYEQAGKWKINARFNKANLMRRLERVIRYKSRISAFNLDALDFLEEEVQPISARKKVFVYLDPPYFVKGQLLYLNAYQEDDHLELAKFIKNQKGFAWLLSYDNVAQVRRMYTGFKMRAHSLTYTARSRRNGRELLIHDNVLQWPRVWRDIKPKPRPRTVTRSCNLN